MSDQQHQLRPADILVVDDEPESLRLLIDILAKRGYKLRPATDGRQALAAARLKPPDLILLDVMMPAQSGFEICEQLKRDEATANIPVIFISALNQTIDKVKAFSLGAVDYIDKPFQVHEVLARVETHLALHHMQQELQQRHIQLQQEMAERQRANEALAYRLDIEKFVSKQIVRFINAYGEQFGSEISQFLEAVGEFIQVDGVAVGVFDQDYSRIDQIFEWPAGTLANGEETDVGVSLRRMSWTLERLCRLETISYEDIAALPPEAGFEKKRLEDLSIKSFVADPLVVRGRLWGFFGYFSRQPREWPQEALWLLQATGQVLAEVFERKRMEQELYELRLQINILFDNSPLGVALTTSEGRILAVNKPLLKMFGFPEAELLALNVTDLYQQRADREQLLERVQTEGVVHDFGVQLKRKDGSLFNASMNVNRLTSSGREVILAMIEDVTPQIELEQALRRREQEVKTLIENSPDVIARFDPEYRHLYVSPAIEQITGLPPKDFIGRSNRDLGMPEPQLNLWEEMLARVFRTKQEVRFDYSFPAADGPRYFESHMVPELAADGTVQSVMGINRDITTRKKAEAALQASEAALKETNQGLERRISELTVLNLIAQTITTVTDFQAALETVVGTVAHLFNASGTSITLLDPAGEGMKVVASFEESGSTARSNPRAEAERSISLDELVPADSGPLRERLLKEGRPISFSPLRTTSPLPSGLDWFQAANIDALMMVPLQIRGEIMGLLTVAANRPGQEFTPDEESLAETIAGQIAGAIEVARLFEEEQRQRRLAESLRQVATALSQSLDQATVLRTIFEQLRQVLAYEGAVIGLIEGDELVISEAIGLSQDYLGYRLSLKSESPLIQVLTRREALILNNTSFNWFQRDEPGSWMGAPLIIGRSLIGLLAIQQGQAGGTYQQEDLQILQIFANQAAISIENARLYEQAQTVAVDAERQRLARELHDSVTQSLYSLTLLTNGWATMAGQGRLEVEKVADHFKQLEGISIQGLREMRLLLHQLRPPVLEKVGLVGALQQRLEAVEHRVNIETRLLTQGEVDTLPIALAEQLFFIAQEALNNAVRHAEATEITVRVQAEDEHLLLTVTDNGKGFEPARPSFGLGLASIRERTGDIEGEVEITSVSGQGTTVKATVPLKPPATG
jgi:PAS domain S-box-containing protein